MTWKTKKQINPDWWKYRHLTKGRNGDKLRKRLDPERQEIAQERSQEIQHQAKFMPPKRRYAFLLAMAS